MPFVSAAKKAKKDTMLKNRNSSKKLGIPDAADSAFDAETPSSDSLPSPAIQDEPLPPPTIENEPALSIPEAKPQLSDEKLNQLSNLHKTNVIKKQLAASKKRTISAQNKLARQARSNKKEEATDDRTLDADDYQEKDDILEGDVVPPVMDFPSSQSSQFTSLPTPTSSKLSSKSPQDLSRSGLYKRKKAHDESVKEDLGSQYRVTDSPPKQASLKDALRWKVRNRITDEAYADLPREFFPSLTSLKKFKNELLDRLRKEEAGGLATAIINYINSLDSFDLENVRVNIGADKGADTTKIIWYLVDMIDPLSPLNLHIDSCYIGDETRIKLKPYLQVINEVIFLLQADPIETKHGLKTFTCFWIADCKMSGESLGVQGGSATCPCHYCTIPSKEWKNLKTLPDSALRTIEDLQASGERIEEAEASQTLTPSNWQTEKTNKSVKATPMITAIPLLRFVPPSVHILISAINTTVKCCKEKNGTDKVMIDEIEKQNIKYHQGTSDFTGPNCRKIVDHFMKHPEIDGFVARDLTETEIDQLDEAIKAYFELIDTNYPDLPGKKTKFHILRFHVMPFVRAFKSWGKFSEQSLEHIHADKNACDRRIPGNTEAAKAKQLQYFTDQQLLRVYFASH
uniref:Uncharacterized protein n=1 Tax=Panagrolaimus superbus TaxID=310955 RepID=A0A914ZC21_9BILA